MGYYSNLCFAVYDNISIPEDVLKILTDGGTPTYGEKINYYFLHDVKWYDSYPEVFKVMKAFNPLFHGGNAAMVRFGEELDDIEEWGEIDKFNLKCVKYITIEGEAFENYILAIGIVNDTVVSKELNQLLKSATDTKQTKSVTY